MRGERPRETEPTNWIQFDFFYPEHSQACSSLQFQTLRQPRWTVSSVCSKCNKLHTIISDNLSHISGLHWRDLSIKKRNRKRCPQPSGEIINNNNNNHNCSAASSSSNYLTNCPPLARLFVIIIGRLIVTIATNIDRH